MIVLNTERFKQTDRSIILSLGLLTGVMGLILFNIFIALLTSTVEM